MQSGTKLKLQLLLFGWLLCAVRDHSDSWACISSEYEVQCIFTLMNYRMHNIQICNDCYNGTQCALWFAMKFKSWKRNKLLRISNLMKIFTLSPRHRLLSTHLLELQNEKKIIEQCNKWLILYEKKQQKNLITELRKFNLNSIEKFNFNSDPFDYLESVKLLRIKETREKERKKNYFVINNGITKNTLNRTETVIEKKNSSQSPLNCEWEKDSFKILFCVLLVCVCELYGCL